MKIEIDEYVCVYGFLVFALIMLTIVAVVSVVCK